MHYVTFFQLVLGNEWRAERNWVFDHAEGGEVILKAHGSHHLTETRKNINLI